MSNIHNTKRTKQDVFGVRRPTQLNCIESDAWKGLEPNLGLTFAQIATTTAMVQGTLTMEFLEHAEVVPMPFAELAITNALDLGWLQVIAEGEYCPLYVPEVLVDYVQMAEESGSSIHEIASEICFDLIEEVMIENPMKVFAKKDALTGLGGPCTAKTWPIVERILSKHPSVLVGSVRNRPVSPTEKRQETGSGNFYRNIFDGKEVTRRDYY